MDASRATLYAFSEQTIVAPFIDNQLVEAHPALAANNNSSYDSSLGCYAQREDVVVQAAQPPPVDASSEPTDDVLPARPLPDPVSAMKFWDDIFDDAMKEFIDNAEAEPDKSSACAIRDKKDWDSVFGQLESARNRFNNTTGVRGKMRKIYRKVADNVQPVIQLTKLVPDIEYTTPVLGAVEFLLEAARNAAEVRKAMSEAFDDLQFHFSVVELFLETYPKDQPIRASSITLVAAIFRAVELAIYYFTSRTWKRAVKITSKWKDYSEELMAKMGEIKEASQQLIQQAELSHMVNTRQALSFVLERMNQWKASCKAVIQKLDEIKQSQQSLRQGQEELKQRQISFELTIKNSLLPLFGSYLSRIDDIYRHTVEYSRPMYLQIDGSQPLYVPSRSPSPLLGAPLTPTMLEPSEMLNALETGLEQKDMEAILAHRPELRSDDIERAHQILTSPKFRAWISHLGPAKLLVHGNFEINTPEASVLSLLCTEIFTGFSPAYPSVIPLVFFCGRHLGPSDANTGPTPMIKSLVSQLLVHLLQIRGEGMWLQPGVVEEAVNGDGDRLCDLFLRLVQRLPKWTTVFVLIDGVGFYEGEKHRDELDTVLMRILEPIGAGHLPLEGGILKVLITNPFVTDFVKDGFEDEWILSVDAIAPGIWELSGDAVGHQVMAAWGSEGRLSREGAGGY
ncbi:hypothetical protein QBC34DRAFT_155738 [Podospora aff. communis PSN243]|uniref:DUF7708 domain-containing protein n=1 Tax=Podospora aff. communis PSN243 TaxID=3040156 RepID=A0AAV9H0W5_9PEZI|nr:hypothetical protein QBC34DRAFT_155738 [Podospora aff. communis PSN243]